MDVHDVPARVVVEQVLAPRISPAEHTPVDRSRPVGESALRAAHPHRRAPVAALVQPGEPVQRMSLRH